MGTRVPHTVWVTRTERIAFQVDATSKADAEDRYLSDGDEVGSETIGTEVEKVEEGAFQDLINGG
jgi:hypothetical protein